MMEEVIKKLEKGNVVLTAPMGWDKAAVDGPGQTTLGAKIAERLAKEGVRVGAMYPTLTLVDRKWESLWSRLDNVIATAGAGQLCARGYKHYPQRFCRKCQLRRLPPEGFNPPAKLHYSELKESLSENVCPYWVQESLMQRYHVVLGHYGRLRRFRDIDILIVDEIHEFVIPEIRQVDLADLRERYELDTSSVEALRESTEILVIAHSDDEELWLLYDLLRMPIVWIEDSVVHGAQLRDLPRDVRILGLTATPPPGWPPEGWELIEVKPEKKPVAYIYTQYEWRYDVIETIDASYHISQVLSFASRQCVSCRIAVFATSSRLQLLPEIVRQRYNADVFDAWGRFRIGVDWLDYDVVVVLWPTLHIEVRRHLRSQGRDPNLIELVNAVQLSGRIRPNDDKIVIFAGARFSRFWDYLSNFYELKEVKL